MFMLENPARKSHRYGVFTRHAVVYRLYGVRGELKTAGPAGAVLVSDNLLLISTRGRATLHPFSISRKDCPPVAQVLREASEKEAGLPGIAGTWAQNPA
jgi:hypothetical protein